MHSTIINIEIVEYLFNRKGVRQMSKNEFICDCNVIHEDKVKKTLKIMPDENTFNKIAEFFKIMGDTTRTKILFALDSNEMCVCDIANVLNMTKSSISHQLGTLRRMNIVKCRREGKEVYYTLDDDHIKEVFEVALEHIKHK